MKFYGKTLFFKCGIMLQITLTYSCNLHCDHCSLEIPTGKRPKAKPIGLEDWKKIIKGFPVRVREVFISGGEPTLISWLPELCNWLLDQGYHVTVFTNLHNDLALTSVKKSHRFQVFATFHQEHDNPFDFTGAYEAVKKVHNISVGELGDRKKILPYSKMSKLFRDSSGLMDREFRYSPDGKLYTSCYEHFVDKSQ